MRSNHPVVKPLNRFVAGMLAALLLGASPEPSPSTAADAQFEALAAAYYAQAFRMEPVRATQAGVHDYDDQLGDYSADAQARRVAFDRDTLAKLQLIDPGTLSPSVALDATLLSNALNDDLLLRDVLQLWRHDPNAYTQAASEGVLGIMARDYAPLRRRLAFAVARERQIPALVAAAEANLISIDAVTQRIASADAAGAAAFFRANVPQAFSGVKDLRLQKQFSASNAAAAKAMAAFATWIGAQKPSGTFAIGADAYQKRLLYEDALDVPLDQYLAYGEAALAQTRAEFVATARRIDPKATPQQVLLSIAKVHPPANALLATASSDVRRLRAFVVAKNLLTLPPDGNIEVVETPAFERVGITAGEDSPGPLETVATQAYYYVTPADPQWSKKQTGEYLGQLNDFGFPIVSAHEVYPGHFTNFSIDRTLDLSLTRRLTSSTEFAEGWAHYSEQMVVDEGWGNGDPRVRLAQLDYALLRECRYVVGFKLHAAGMMLDQAERTYVERCFQSPQVAAEESLRGTQDPMEGVYTLGKLMILKLRDDYRRKLGSGFTLQKFHDELLSRGDPPIPLLRPFVLGADDDGRPL